MKKNKIIVLLTMTTSLAILAGCGYTDSRIKSHTTRNVPFYANIGDATPLATLPIEHFNDSTVGYVGLKTLFPTVQADPVGKAYSLGYVNHSAVITNESTKATLTIDFDNQTFTYSNLDKYHCYDDPYIQFMDVMIDNFKEAFVTSEITAKYEDTGKEKVVDLKAYNIPIYMCGGEGYIPVDIFRQFICPQLTFNLFYNGKAVYNHTPAEKGKEALISYRTQGDIFNAGYMEYTYNLLALQLDTWHGLDERTLRCDGSTVKYLPNGAYQAMQPYHDRLVSLEMNVSDLAFNEFMNTLDDGGHTGTMSHNCMIDEKYQELPLGKEMQYKDGIEKRLTQERDDAGFAPSKVIKDQTGLDNKSTHCFQVTGDTAFLTFDSFAHYTGKFNEAVNENNYWQNTFFTVIYANSIINQNKNIKNLVVDLSLNTGGATAALNFMGSWLCHGLTTKVRNVINNSYQETTVYGDVNRNGKLDDEDFLRSDVNLYVVQSVGSYSCAGILPCLLKDQSSAKFIGGRSGGGSCLVFDYLTTGLGSFFASSGNYQIGRKSSSSFTNFTSVESGVDADFYPISYSDEEIGKFYDRTEIMNKIHEVK